jgi:hypothetical protein
MSVWLELPVGFNGLPIRIVRKNKTSKPKLGGQDRLMNALFQLIRAGSPPLALVAGYPFPCRLLSAAVIAGTARLLPALFSNASVGDGHGKEDESLKKNDEDP